MNHVMEIAATVYSLGIIIGVILTVLIAVFLIWINKH